MPLLFYSKKLHIALSSFHRMWYNEKNHPFRRDLERKDVRCMEYSDGAIVKIGKFSGEGNIAYQEADGRFTVSRNASASGAGVVVGVMFGALGRAIMDGVSDSVELTTFTAGDIRQVETQEKRSKMVFTLYPANGEAPYIITIAKKKQLCAILHRELVEQKATAPKPAVSAPPPAPAPLPQAPVSPPAPMPYEPPMQPPVQAPIQAPIQPPVQAPMQPPIQPPVQAPIQPPMQPAAPQQRPAAAAPAQRADALLSLRTGPMAGSVFRCAPGSRVVIGRDPSRSTLALSRYVNVSGVHCCVEVGNGCLRVTDLNSTNGTYVNGTRLQPNQPVMLRAGDVLKLANDVCIFQIAFE